MLRATWRAVPESSQRTVPRISRFNFRPRVWLSRMMNESINSPAGGNASRAYMADLDDLEFSNAHKLSIVTFSVMMVVSAVGNITVLTTLMRKNKRSRINLMLMHLAIGDLLVTFLTMPMEIAWSSTVEWLAGSTACHILAFVRVFGFYVSSSVLVCITVDRYFAVLKPMSLKGQSAKYMLTAAWIVSIMSSLPQVAVFHLASHPIRTNFTQCVAYDAFQSPVAELAYNLFHVAMTYCIPLLVIIFCYVSILMEICRRSKDSSTDTFRRSSLGYLGRAKVRTLKMTIIIVLAFIVCWTPYCVMCIWFMLDWPSALAVPKMVQKSLFLFATANCSMNPIVYGFFNIRNCSMNRSMQQSSGTSPPRRTDKPARISGWRKKTESVRRDILLDLMLRHKPTDPPTAR